MIDALRVEGAKLLVVLEPGVMLGLVLIIFVGVVVHEWLYERRKR